MLAASLAAAPTKSLSKGTGDTFFTFMLLIVMCVALQIKMMRWIKPLARFFAKYPRLALGLSFVLSITFGLLMQLSTLVILAASFASTGLMKRYFQMHRTGALVILRETATRNVRIAQKRSKQVASVAKFTFKTVRLPMTIGEKVIDIFKRGTDEPS